MSIDTTRATQEPSIHNGPIGWLVVIQMSRKSVLSSTLDAINGRNKQEPYKNKWRYSLLILSLPYKKYIVYLVLCFLTWLICVSSGDEDISNLVFVFCLHLENAFLNCHYNRDFKGNGGICNSIYNER